MTSQLFADYRPDAQLAPSQSRAAVEIRSAGVDDVAGIAALTAERSGAPLEVCLKSARRQLAADADRGHLTLVADVGGGVVGFSRARFHHASAYCADLGDAPAGWYLLGMIVAPPLRRRGIGTELTRHRLAWIAERADEAYYFANSLNLASIDLHRRLGFVELCRPFRFPGCEFTGGGVGVLFRAPLHAGHPLHIC
jgi:ribosomal protein S18 acetylase RimI-like enzyme